MRLIDADMIEPHEQLEPIGNGEYEFALVVYMDDINELPSVDAVPVRRGRWLSDNRPGGGFWVCSSCKFPSEAFAANILYKFCPNCGADMRKRETGCK